MRGLGIVVVLAGCEKVLGLVPATAIDADLPPPPGTWAQVALGFDHTCALRSDASLYCWGNDSQGQLGQGVESADLGEPTRVSGTWLAIAAAGSSTCGIRDDHSLWCWGTQLGATVDVTEPTMVDPGPWSAVALASTHGCVLAPDGHADCWGTNTFGELGNGATGMSLALVPVQPTQRWTAISVGEQHSCALADDASMWCWGARGNGALGDGMNLNNATAPVRVDAESWTAVSAAGIHTCGLLGNGGLRCWGNNTYGEVGADLGGAYSAYTPVAVGADEAPWTSIGTGRYSSCAVNAANQLWCWGSNANGELGAAAEARQLAPARIRDGAHNWTSVTPGSISTCALGDDHNMWCFGLSRLGATSSVPRPTQVPGSWQAVRAGEDVTCALDTAGELSCWGLNSDGQLGDASYTNRSAPTAIGKPWLAFSIESQAACAIAVGGALSCWGNNMFGLGDGSTMRTIPTAIPGGPWSDIATGYSFACGISAGSLYGWGANFFGQLASSDTLMYTMPHLSTSNPGNWTSVSAGESHACGIASGAALCWGDNTFGELGVGSGPSSTPELVMPADRVTAAFEATCAIANGAGSCWGHNDTGQVGDGTTVDRSAPVPLVGSWRDLSPGKQHTCGIQSDGSLWCWGDDSSSQLGDGAAVQQASPERIDPAGWQQVSAGGDHTCAIKTDHSLWCWGSNVYGQLGLGTSTFGKPVFVP